jgi:hypothetical protein
MANVACRECGCGISVVTSRVPTVVNGVWWATRRVHALAHGDSTGPSGNRAAEAAGAAAAGGSACTAQAHEARELTSKYFTHKLLATVIEVKQHVRREVRGGAADAAAGAEEESARPFFWQDEHAVQRQHIFVQGGGDSSRRRC